MVNLEFPCQSDTARSRFSVSNCGRPAREALKVVRWTVTPGGKEDVYKPLCKRHAAAERRRSWTSDPIVDITPEVADSIQAAIASRRAATLARQEAEAEKQRAAAEVARAEAQRFTTTPFEVVRDDEQKPNWDTSREKGEVVYDIVPAWRVKPRGNESSYWADVMMVKVTSAHGEPRLEVNNGSRLTPRAARALARTLVEAADVAEESL